MDNKIADEITPENPYGPPTEDPFLFDLEPMQKLMVRIGSKKHVQKLSKRMRIDLEHITSMNYPDMNVLSYEMPPIKFKTPDQKQMTPEMRERWKNMHNPEWKQHWHQMPVHIQENINPEKTLELYFPKKCIDEISEILEQPITEKTKHSWYPRFKKGKYAKWAWQVDKIINPQFPIYIISKGRPKCLTAQVLASMDVPYRIVVEPVDYDDYLKEHPADIILTLPFSDLGKGSIPARNWVWEHSIAEGYKWHWILDDNIEGFNRLYRNARIRVRSGVVFKVVEDFILRYENIGQAGLNYNHFRPAMFKSPPYSTNTRIYSCILNRNDLDLRWRGKYNEDTDLSLRIMKQGLVTVLFDNFLACKMATQVMKGGNTDNVYTDGDNRHRFAESLMKQHPNECSVVWRYNRWHHHVDYSSFKKNKLKLKSNYVVPEGINNYGLKLKRDKFTPRGIPLNEIKK